MHKIETLLFGIALILFGIASILIFEDNGWSLFGFTGVVSPILGLVVSFIGLFDKDYSGNEEKTDNENDD